MKIQEKQNLFWESVCACVWFVCVCVCVCGLCVHCLRWRGASRTAGWRARSLRSPSRPEWPAWRSSPAAPADVCSLSGICYSSCGAAADTQHGLLSHCMSGSVTVCWYSVVIFRLKPVNASDRERLWFWFWWVSDTERCSFMLLRQNVCLNMWTLQRCYNRVLHIHATLSTP